MMPTIKMERQEKTKLLAPNVLNPADTINPSMIKIIIPTFKEEALDIN